MLYLGLCRGPLLLLVITLCVFLYALLQYITLFLKTLHDSLLPKDQVQTPSTDFQDPPSSMHLAYFSDYFSSVPYFKHPFAAEVGLFFHPPHSLLNFLTVHLYSNYSVHTVSKSNGVTLKSPHSSKPSSTTTFPIFNSRSDAFPLNSYQIFHL